MQVSNRAKQDSETLSHGGDFKTCQNKDLKYKDRISYEAIYSGCIYE